MFESRRGRHFVLGVDRLKNDRRSALEMTDLDVQSLDLDRLAAAAIRAEDAGDIESAVSLYKIGASLRDATCTTRLADLLSEPPQYLNVTLAEELYKTACAAGHGIACHNLAILYGQLGRTALRDRYMRFAKSRGEDPEAEID